ncbi:Riboflavin synthase [Salinivirga cyanobacteriivorans]|uniref:Riboflavin synthase n=1 Tax=Salinivirga cyanobacteriivorans TaxID=1307839 RepID=A0A0S2I0Q3_9BACT|nr:riboflavin synthase [Salinivirga cyanobacteriivorans]ALO15870.1 Riboflavin synthase [Salinivirga cyanobacteriivorans]
MFSGIVEEPGKVVKVEKKGENVDLTITCAFVDELAIDQSISHNGVCLTVVDKTDNDYTVTAVKETLLKSSLGNLKPGDLVNLERSVKADGRLDGHMVQGHVDQTATVTNVEEADGSWYFTFKYEPKGDNITVEKGSVSIDGVSMTVVNSRKKTFQVAVIPYTYEHTVFKTYEEGTIVNLEFDIIGKYITKVVKQVLGKE